MLNESLSSDDYSDLSICEIRSIDESGTTPKTPEKSTEDWNRENFLDETVTVKFKCNDEELFTKAFSRRATINDIKSELINLLQISSDDEVSIEKVGKNAINEETMLADLGVAALGIIELNVKMNSASKLNKNLIYGYIPTLDVITVQIHGSGIATKTLVVEIEDERGEKPWLGGYRHRITGKRYHHASTQTSRNDKLRVPKCSRYVQFKPTKETATNTAVDETIQISPYMFSLMSKSDVILRAREQAPESFITELNRDSYKDDTSEFAPDCRYSDEVMLNETPSSSPLLSNQPTNAKYIHQLNTIRDEIENWKTTQLQSIQINNEPEQISKQRTHILSQTIKFLTRLNEYKSKIRDPRSKAQQILEKYAKPATLHSSTGTTITIETVLNQKAKQLKQLFHKYDQNDATVIDTNEKINLIHQMINFFEQNAKNDKYSNDIVDLLRQHIELLNNGVNETESLRSRVRQRVLHFFNYAGSNSIFDTNNQTDIIAAQPHQHYDRRSREADYTQTTAYRKLLEGLQDDEMKRFNSYDSVCFTMNTKQFVYLVREIWRNTPVASDGDYDRQDDINRCRMTRWNVKKAWSPWNCVLLPVNQLRVHWNVDNVDCYYDAAVVANVKSKHSMAKIYFQRLM